MIKAGKRFAALALALTTVMTATAFAADVPASSETSAQQQGIVERAVVESYDLTGVGTSWVKLNRSVLNLTADAKLTFNGSWASDWRELDIKLQNHDTGIYGVAYGVGSGTTRTLYPFVAGDFDIYVRTDTGTLTKGTLNVTID